MAHPLVAAATVSILDDHGTGPVISFRTSRELEKWRGAGGCQRGVADAATEAKSRFTNMSHEIRTPMNATWFTEALSCGGLRTADATSSSTSFIRVATTAEPDQRYFDLSKVGAGRL
jgi:hypothetical protein